MKRRNKSIISLEIQKEVFRKYGEYFNNENDLPSPCDKIFKDISTEMQCQMSAKALYLSLKRNYNFFFNNSTDDGKCSTSDRDSTSTVYDYDSETEYKEENENEDDDIDDKKRHRTFKFTLDMYHWEKIQPITKYIARKKTKSKLKSSDRKNILPKYQWAHILREEIWKATKIPCSWTFKTQSVKYGDRISCHGSCTLCNADIKVVINWPTDKIIFCEGYLTNYDPDCHHTQQKKIKMTPVQRKDLCQNLKHQAAVVVHKKLTDKIMSDGDPEPPHLPTPGCLRQIKYEDNNSQFFHQHPILALWAMTTVTPYKDFIRQISLYPLYVHYWSSSQDFHYKKYIQNNRLILSLDATGSIFKQIGPTNDDNGKHIFLYSAVMYDNNNGRSIPITQMVSENQDMDTIGTWLKAWVAKKSPPNEVIVDDSAALIGAVVTAFTPHKSTKEYVTASYNKLNNNQKTPDETYIRIDKSHFVKIIMNLSCFQHVDSRVKWFFCRCLLYVRQCDSYDEVKKIISDLLTVSLHRFVSPGTRCEEALSRLKQILRDKDVAELQNESYGAEKERTGSIFDGNNHDTGSNIQSTETSNVPKWYKDQIDTENLFVTLCDDDTPDSLENLYYFPSFEKTLTRLVSQLPLWSNVMMMTYNSERNVASSSNIESMFKTIKRYLCDIATKSQRLRVDEFLIKHCEYLSGELKIAVATEKSKNYVEHKSKNIKKDDRTKTNNSKKEFTDDSVFIEYPSLVENWKGLGARVKKQKKTKTPKISSSICLLINGSKTVTGTKGITLNNTCAFDSVSQVIAIGCTEGFDLNRTVRHDSNIFCRFITKLVESNKLNQELYQLRAEILGNFFEKKVLNNVLTISCECSATYIFERILIDTLYSAKVTENCTNSSCAINNLTRKVAFVPLDSTDISALNRSAENMLCDENNMVQCRRNNCAGIRTFTYQLQNTIFFELSQSDFINLVDVPVTLKLYQTSYTYTYN